MEIRQRCACWQATRRLILGLHRTTIPLHALVNTPLCILTLVLGNGATTGHCAPMPAAAASSNQQNSQADYYYGDYGGGGGGGDYQNSDMMGSDQAVLGYPEPGERAPGYRYSYNGMAPQKYMYEGVIICLLAVTAFIGLVVWVLKSNFEERQTRRMRREASLRDRNSNVSPLMTPDSEES